MKYALTKNTNIAEKPSKTVKILQHDQCKGDLTLITKGANAGQYQCSECYKSGFLVKKLPPPKIG